MNAFENLMHGFALALTPMHVVWSLVGVTLGTAIGVLPGVGPSVTIALLLPLTFQLDPASAFILFGGIYYGAMYGGSTSAILLNMPGESTSIITAVDGYEMARRGRAAAALATAAIGSFVAGTLGTLALTFVAPTVVEFALKFGPPEYFALTLLAFATTTSVMGNSLVRGMAALSLGILVGLVGVDLQTGQARLTFGVPDLLDGIEISVIAIGLFAVGEILHQALHPSPDGAPTRIQSIDGPIAMSRSDLARSWKPWLRGTAIGFPIGALPAGGGEIPTFLSYAVEKRLSKNPAEFGHGAIEGIAGPEAANNASTAGVLLPLLTLGLPTSTTAAIMLAAFQSYGIRPGPFLLENQSDLFWSLVASLLIGNFFLLVLNLPLARTWAKLVSVPTAPLYGGILVLATVGTYSIGQSALDLFIMYLFGFIGYAMRRFDFPVTPVIVGMIIGPIAEQELRRSMMISHGDPSIFVTRPISAVLMLAVALIVIGPLMARVLRRKATKTVAA